MLKFKSLLRGGALLATAGLAATLLMSSVEPSSAGLFSWMKGPQANQGGEDSGGYGGPGLFGGGLFGGGQRGPQQPGSQAFHGDELPPEEGDAATRAWILNPALGTPTLAKANVAATQAAIAKYRAIVANGGWPMIPATAMHPGSTGPEVVTLHRRLEISGDLVGMSVPQEYDAALVAAVKKFQARHGFPPTGVINSHAMIDALNVPATVRLAQLEANLKRIQTLSTAAANRYVVVNIPSAQVEAVELWAGGAAPRGGRRQARTADP